MKPNIKKITIIAITLLVGLLAGIWLGKSTTTNKAVSSISSEHDIHQEHRLWTCSMHPQIKQDKPGQCPICGMDLIPLQQETRTAIDPDAVTLSEEAIALAQIKTVPVRKSVPRQSISLSGTIEPDERRIEKLTARFGGRIEKLYINFTGQKVYRGQKIAEIYAPELITAQQELWDAAQNKNEQPALYQAARNKLKFWQLTDHQIDRLENTQQPVIRFPILSPVSGYVQTRKVSEGDYIKEGQVLFEITPLNRVWVMLDTYEADLHRIKKDNKVLFKVDAIPDKIFAGKVQYIDPFVNPETRVAKLRVEAVNTGMQLKPGMFVNAEVITNLKAKESLLIPKTAVLWTGKRSVVFVKDGLNFTYREIILGPEAGDYYIVLSGLQEGEEVVSQAAFKIDAAAQLLGKPSMMNSTGGKTNTGHNHGDKPMNDEETKTKYEKKHTQTEMKCAPGKCGN